MSKKFPENIKKLVSVIIFIAINLSFLFAMGRMAEYVIKVFFNKDLPFCVDVVVGVIGNAFTIVAWLVALCWN